MLNRFREYFCVIAITVTSCYSISHADNVISDSYTNLVQKSIDSESKNITSRMGYEILSDAGKIAHFEKLPIDSLLSYDEYIEYGDSYSRLNENGSAIQLFKAAYKMDPDNKEALYKLLVSAFTVKDSILIVEQIVNLVGKKDLSNYGDCIEIAFQNLSNNNDSANLKLLLNKTETRLDNLPVTVAWWHAVTYYNEGRYESALNCLINLVSCSDSEIILSQNQRVWTVTTIPQILFIQSKYLEAKAYYELLAENINSPEIKASSELMICRIDLLTSEFAGNYTELASDSDVFEHRTINKLSEIKKKGAGYGIDDIYNR